MGFLQFNGHDLRHENTMTSDRKKIPRQIEELVLTSCLRRCCVCYFIHQVATPKKGQIAHVNKKRDDHRIENLVFLCFDHHDEFDSTTSQSKNLTAGEILHYKQQLAERMRSLISHGQQDSNQATPPRFDDILSRPWKHNSPWPGTPLLFPYKSPNGCDGICRIEKVEIEDGRVVIICEEDVGNPGMSVTNAIEFIAAQVCLVYEIHPSELVLIEHYDKSVFGSDEWNLVTFGTARLPYFFENPSWAQMSASTWQSLGLILTSEDFFLNAESNSRIQKLTQASHST